MKSRSIFTLLFIFLLFNFSIYSQKTRKTEVFILSTLHQFHTENKNYSFEKLSQIIENLKPDIIAVELTPSDLKSRREQKTKQEYQKSIFPVADKNKYQLVPLEPAEPKFSELVGLVRDSEMEIREKSPEKAEAFSIYSDKLYENLFRFWDSPMAVNSAQTDALLEVKHDFQNALYGEKQTRGWEGWNNNFLEKILETAKENPGKRIVVTVGVEHAYWLRKHLRDNKTISLLEPQKFLKIN